MYLDPHACGCVGILLLAEQSVLSLNAKVKYDQTLPADNPNKAIKITTLFMLVQLSSVVEISI